MARWAGLASPPRSGREAAKTHERLYRLADVRCCGDVPPRLTNPLSLFRREIRDRLAYLVELGVVVLVAQWIQGVPFCPENLFVEFASVFSADANARRVGRIDTFAVTQRGAKAAVVGPARDMELAHDGAQGRVSDPLRRVGV